MQRLYDAWHQACAFVDGPDGNLVVIAIGVGVAIVIVRFDPRFRRERRAS